MTVPHAIQFTTRFLFPLRFGRDRAHDAATALAASTICGVEHAWRVQADSHHLYRDELLDHVKEHLFPGGPGERVAAYLQLDDRLCSKIFNGLVAAVDDGTHLPVHLVRNAGCELFLSRQGVGVLSIGLEVNPGAFAADTVLRFNYLASRRYANEAPLFLVPHPQDDRARWERIPEEKRSAIRPPPPQGAAISDRLAAPGGAFDLAELVAHLTAPLRAEHVLRGTPGAPATPAPFVFTGVLFDEGVDFEDREARRAIAPFLSALAQVEEPLHAGAVSDEPGVATVLLNRKHWAATGQLGSAHLLANQGVDARTGTPHTFDGSRVPRVALKYFAAYLVALLQRLTLERSLLEAGEIVSAGHPEGRQLHDLRTALLEFAVGGHFPTVSSRHAVQRYYRSAREGMAIRDLWEDVRRAIGDLDASHAADAQQQLKRTQAELAANQHRLTEQMSQSLERGNHMQGALHTIEVFLVAVYSAEFMHAVLGTVKPLLEHHTGHQPLGLTIFHWLEPILVVGAAAAGFIATRMFIRSREHGAGHSTAPGPEHPHH